MPPTLRRVFLCLLACSLKAAEVSTAPLLVSGPLSSRGLDEDHDSTRWLQRTSEDMKPNPSWKAFDAQEEKGDGEEAGQVATAAAPGAAPAEAEEVGPSDSNQFQCWIFTHLLKAGGSTIRSLLQHVWGSETGIYDNKLWKIGDEYSLEFGEQLATGNSRSKVMTGGYSEALRRSPAVDSTCRFFTMFRHPVSRMVSAYFYCHVHQGDQACASLIVRARNVDLLTFAKHWSNFAVRQFAFRFVPADDVLAYANSPQARELVPKAIKHVRSLPAWYLLKMYLERPEAVAEARGATAQPELGFGVHNEEKAEEGVPDAALYQFLQPAKDLLSDGYAAVGVLEEFNTTLSLFDATLDMPGMDWHQEFKHVGAVNALKPKAGIEQKKADLLELAWKDSELKRYMQLDLLLYEHAVDVFHEQSLSQGLL